MKIETNNIKLQNHKTQKFMNNIILMSNEIVTFYALVIFFLS